MTKREDGGRDCRAETELASQPEKGKTNLILKGNADNVAYKAWEGMIFAVQDLGLGLGASLLGTSVKLPNMQKSLQQQPEVQRARSVRKC